MLLEMTTDSFVSTFSIIMSAISPIAVTVLSAIIARKEMKDKKYKKLAEEKEALEREKKEKEELEKTEMLSRLENKVDSLSDKVSTFEEELDSIKESTSNLREISEVNFNFVQSLGRVVATMGDSIIENANDDDDYDSLRKAIHEHRHTEESITSQLFKIKS